MNRFLYTSAIALAMGGFAFGVHAQESQTNNKLAASVCDTPWTQIDADGNAFVSNQEASSAVENQFSAIDADSDGKLDFSEYQACLTGNDGKRAAETDRSEENFEQADANKDNVISAEEYRDLAQLSYENVQEAQDAGVNSEPFVVLRRFIWLTPDEAANADMTRNMSADEAAGRAAWNFSSLDQNDDSRVSVEEWRERTATSTANADRMRADFDQMDADSSDSVSQGEYLDAQSQKFDTTTTASTNSGGSDQASSGSASGDEGLGNHGVPVYVFRFLPY